MQGLKVLFNFAEVQLNFLLKMMQKNISPTVKSFSQIESEWYDKIFTAKLLHPRLRA